MWTANSPALRPPARRLGPARELPGIASIAATGHTPGHTAFSVSSGSKSLLYVADVTNNPWQAIFDADGNKAADTRKMLLDRAAADKMLAHGYYWPFPASGYIVKIAKGYDLVPAMWSPTL